MKTLLLSLALTSAAFGVTAPENMPFEVKVTGKGRPIILIPGLSSSGETWDTTVARYQDRFQCHVLTVAGFAGVPRVPGPMLERVRDGIAEYVRKNKLERPVVIGHSLGGYIAMDYAAKYPALTGSIVIVDSYPFFGGIGDPNTTPEQARANGDSIRKSIAGQSRDQYNRYVKSGVSTRMMVEKESDFERIVEWGLKSDPTAVGDAMAELYSGDLRPELPKIKCPALLLAEWASWAQYTDRARTEANLKAQYAKLEGVEIHINDKARHFIMWDDPEWMFGHLDRFLLAKKK
jgi:pimeloyl-ACP methyl ester carboxylesterase